MPNHLLYRLHHGIPALAGALLLLIGTPGAATDRPDAPPLTHAERCRQLVRFDNFDHLDAAALPACQQAVQENPQNAALNARLCGALQQAERYGEALAYCRSAAEAGNFLGIICLLKKFDESVAQDDAPAMVAGYRQAAEQGLVYAQVILGQMYTRGCCGIEKDDAQAAAWYGKAAAQGNAVAQVFLSRIYRYGIGVAQDHDQAVAWALQSLTNGQKDAEWRDMAAWTLGHLKDSRAVEPLIAALKDADKDVRAAAADGLGELNDRRATEPLIAALRDVDADVRWNAASALGQLNDSRAVEPLLAALKDADQRVRQSAVWALGRMKDPRAVEPLIAALKDADQNVRKSAAWALGQLEDLRAVKPLLVALEDADEDVRTAAAEALGWLKDSWATEPLIAALKDKDQRVRQNAAWMLGEMLNTLKDLRATEPLIAALKDADKDVRKEAARALGRLEDSRAVEPLIVALKDADEGVRAAAAEALGWLTDSRAVEPLIVALKDADEGVRAAAALGLSWLTDSRAVEPLITALKDANQNVRKWAALALVPLNDPRAVEPLIAALKDADQNVRKFAASALSRLKDPRAVEPLIVALKDADKDVRKEAAEVLGELKDPRAVEALLAALKDADKDVRKEAARALGRLKDPRVVDPLIAALKDADEDVRAAAAGELGWLEDPRAVEPLLAALKDADQNVRKFAASALSRLKDPRAVEALLAALKDADKDVRQNAAKALGRLEDSRPVEPLIAALKDANKDVRGAAAKALGELKDSRAVEPLLVALKDADKDVRQNAAKALGELKDPRAVEALLAALKDADKEVRVAAARTLGELKDSRAVEPLLVALKDADKDVRQKAAEALGELKDPRAVEPLLAALRDAKWSIRSEAMQALGALKYPRTVEALLAALKDTSSNVRPWVAVALGQLKDPRAVEPLLAVLHDADGLLLRTAAVLALGLTQDPRAVEPLLAALRDTDKIVRMAAVKALDELKDPRAVEPLLAALRDADLDVRRQAVEALIPLNGLADARIVTVLPGFLLKQRQDWLKEIPRYTLGALALLHLNTAATAYLARLQALDALWAWSGPRAAVTEAVLDADLAVVSAAVSPEAVTANPYLALFVARLHQEQGRNEAALIWLDRARARLPTYEIAPQIVLGWIEIQARRQAGQLEPALAVVTRLERDLLPRLAEFERTGLAFASQTLALKGILLSNLGQRRAAIEALYAASDARTRERQQHWITETTDQQIQQVIGGFQAAVLDQESKALADAALQLAAQTPPTSRLGQEAELKALESRLRAALGEGDAALAQHLTEQWLLKQQAAPPTPGSDASDRQRTIQRLQDLQNRLQQLGRAQDAAERAVQQAAQAQLARGMPDAQSASPVPADAQQRLADAQQRLTEVQQQRAQARRDLAQFMLDLKTAHPDLAALYGAEPQELSRLQSRLRPDQRLIQYLLLNEQGWVFVASASTLQVVSLGVGRRLLREAIDHYRELLQQPAARRGFTLTVESPPTSDRAGQTAALAQNLTQLLLEPLRAAIGEAQHLLLVPNGPLHRLPFAALPWDGGFLIQQYRLSTLSSASLLTALADPPPIAAPHLLALADANPDAPLPQAAAEVQAIARHFAEPAVYTGSAARRDRLVGQDLDGWMLHLAVHGFASTPDRTRLRLSDGDLSYLDILGLRLDAAPLVVLSACETGLGAQLSGDEVVSLANGFVGAGARAVVSSLWPVPDPETKALMELFYAHRSEGHAAALAAAQRTLIVQGYDPYQWAGFVVGGW